MAKDQEFNFYVWFFCVQSLCVYISKFYFHCTIHIVRHIRISAWSVLIQMQIAKKYTLFELFCFQMVRAFSRSDSAMKFKNGKTIKTIFRINLLQTQDKRDKWMVWLRYKVFIMLIVLCWLPFVFCSVSDSHLFRWNDSRTKRTQTMLTIGH